MAIQMARNWRVIKLLQERSQAVSAERMLTPDQFIPISEDEQVKFLNALSDDDLLKLLAVFETVDYEFRNQGV